MAAFVFDALYFSIIVFLAAAVPGIAVGWPLVFRLRFSTTEKLLLSFFIGLLAAPTALFLLSLLGLKFSFFLVFAVNFAILSLGLFFGIKSGAFDFKLPSLEKAELKKQLLFDHAPSALLLLALLIAFWIRIQPFSPVYSELDPYFYVYGTGQIIREGIQPLVDDTAWWPEILTTHRGQPLKKYLEAQWYSLYTNGGEYNNYLLFTTSSWLPPLSAAFVSFGAYLLISSIYGRKYGLFAAYLLAFLPITIYKMSAGVNEAVPIGMMTLFMAMGVFAHSLKSKEALPKALSALFIAFAILSSNYLPVIAILLSGLAVLHSIYCFFAGKNDENFYQSVLFACAGFFIATLLLGLYFESLVRNLASPYSVLVASSAAFMLGVKHLLSLEWGENKRKVILASAMLFALALFFLTPIGSFAKGIVSNYLSAVEFSTALERTIAEQNLAGESFETEAGFIAAVPKNHIQKEASGLGALSNIFYFLLAAVASVFTFLGNFALSLANSILSFLFGLKQAASKKEDSLFFVFLILSSIGLLISWLIQKRKAEGEEASGYSAIPLLILLMTLPVIYVGITKVKYTIFAGIMIAVCAPVALAELERLAKWVLWKLALSQHAKHVSLAFTAILVLSVYLQAAGPVPLGYIVSIKSFEMRYQDNPQAMSPKAAELCKALMDKGVSYTQIKALCEAGYNPKFAESMDNQFNADVCWLSQMKAEELFPKDAEAKQRTEEAIASARFKCSRISDYWLNSMEWMRDNLNNSDRVTSWWDYGHWTNYFADKKTVLRNEHASLNMIGRVAHDFIIGSPQDLAQSMDYFDSQYVLFDVEIIGGDIFGGKYGALNYLGCVYKGETSLEKEPGTSKCEFDHSPEKIAIDLSQTPENSCTISESQQRKGVFAYRFGIGESIDFSKPAYCVGEAKIATGEAIFATYYLDRKDANGNLALSKGFIKPFAREGDFIYAQIAYDNQKVWLGQNGQLVDGMEDAKTAFYTSNLYRGFYLEDLPGFELVYKTKNGEVKIYKLKNFSGNKERRIDSAMSNKAN